MLLYAYDGREAVKNVHAIWMLDRLREQGAGCLSTQNLAEFMNSARKLSITNQKARQYVAWFVEAWRIFDLTPAVVLEAARGVRDHALAYYDAQLWATAKLNQIPVIFSEDFNSGATLEGVRFVNPFAPTFRMDDWV
ncbi:MAG: PIN domain-containing protein [Caldilineaceae bacterium]|nr:PIN domain-containing protein [Caldilineaceae bacterium]